MSAVLSASQSTATEVRSRIDGGSERIWRFEDFRDLPFSAVAKALSRLTRTGELERLSPGIYYRARNTTFGRSQPNPSTMRKLAARGKPFFPSGLAAANHLGFSTQTSPHGEVSTCAASLPRKLIGNDTIVHTRRPETWSKLSESDAALLDFLRNGGHTSELSPQETIQRTLALLSEPGRYKRLLSIANAEPPRVRALLGALGDALGRKHYELKRLRESINPLSQFEFGTLADLPTARRWQARERRA